MQNKKLFVFKQRSVWTKLSNFIVFRLSQLQTYSPRNKEAKSKTYVMSLSQIRQILHYIGTVLCFHAWFTHNFKLFAHFFPFSWKSLSRLFVWACWIRQPWLFENGGRSYKACPAAGSRLTQCVPSWVNGRSCAYLSFFLISNSSVFTLHKMREIVHIQAGQCGNQIGAKVNTFIFRLSFYFANFFLCDRRVPETAVGAFRHFYSFVCCSREF